MKNMNWFLNTIKLAAAKDKIQRYKIANPSVKFFIEKYESIIPWDQMEKINRSEGDVETSIQKYIGSNLIPSLQKKIDEKSDNNNYMKPESISDDDVKLELRIAEEAQGRRPSPSYSESQIQHARVMLLNDINKEKKKQFDRWWGYINEEEVYKSNPAFQFSVLKPIIDSSSAEQKNSPPPLNAEILAGIWEDINEKGVSQLNILKKYKQLVMQTEQKKSAKPLSPDEGQWVRIKGNGNVSSPKELQENIDRLKSLSQGTGWCTARGMADTYLPQGDFYLYLKNGHAVVAIRLVKNRVAEIRGNDNNQNKLNPYWQEVISFLSDKPFDYNDCAQYKILQEIHIMNANLTKGSVEYNMVMKQIQKDHKTYMKLSQKNKQEFPEFLEAAKQGYALELDGYLREMEEISGTGTDPKGKYLYAFDKFKDYYDHLEPEIKTALGDLKPRIIEAHKKAFRNNPYLFPEFPADIQKEFTPQEQMDSWRYYISDDPYRFNDQRIPPEIRKNLGINQKTAWAKLLEQTANHLDYLPKNIISLFSPQEIEHFVLQDFAKMPVANMEGKLYKLERAEELAKKGFTTHDKIVNILKSFSMSHPNLDYLIPENYKAELRGGKQEYEVNYLLQDKLQRVLRNPGSFNLLPRETQKALLEQFKPQIIDAFQKEKEKYYGLLGDWWEATPENVRSHMPLDERIAMSKYYATALVNDPSNYDYLLAQVPQNLKAMTLREYEKMQRGACMIRELMRYASPRKNKIDWFTKLGKKDEFEYVELIKEFWNEVLSKEKERVNIGFDLENNEPVDKAKYIEIDREHSTGSGDKEKYRIYAQLMAAGGDWQNKVYYFRCQVDTKRYYATSKEWNDRWSKAEYSFVYIPDREEGNKNLIESKDEKGRQVATDNGEEDGYDFKPKDIKTLWKNLEKDAYNRITEYYDEYYGEYDPDVKKINKKYNIFKRWDLSNVFRKGD